MMLRYLEAGGKIDQVRERRPRYKEWSYHYDFRLAVGRRLLYVETRYQVKNGKPFVRVVNVHWA